MEDLLLYFFKEHPEVINTYYKFRPVMVNIILFGMMVTALLTKNERVRSLSIGMAIGIVLVNIGESFGRIRGNKKIPAGSESVNG